MSSFNLIEKTEQTFLLIQYYYSVEKFIRTIDKLFS